MSPENCKHFPRVQELQVFPSSRGIVLAQRGRPIERFSLVQCGVQLQHGAGRAGPHKRALCAVVSCLNSRMRPRRWPTIRVRYRKIPWCTLPHRLAYWLVGGQIPPMAVGVFRICSFSSLNVLYVTNNETIPFTDVSATSIPPEGRFRFFFFLLAGVMKHVPRVIGLFGPIIFNERVIVVELICSSMVTFVCRMYRIVQ